MRGASRPVRAARLHGQIGESILPHEPASFTPPCRLMMARLAVPAWPVLPGPSLPTSSITIPLIQRMPVGQSLVVTAGMHRRITTVPEASNYGRAHRPKKGGENVSAKSLAQLAADRDTVPPGRSVVEDSADVLVAGAY